MNHQEKFRKLYWELYAAYQKIVARSEKLGHNVPQSLADETDAMWEFLLALQKKAAEEKVDLGKEGETKFEEKSHNDWLQTIDLYPGLEDEIKTKLKKHIISLKKYPDAELTFAMMETIEKYYDANVGSPNSERVIEAFEHAFKKDFPNEEADAITEKYRKSAYAAILEGIKKINTSFVIESVEIFNTPFDSYFKGQKALPSELTDMKVPLQFKVDLAQKSWGTSSSFLCFKFTELTIQASFKFGFSKAAHIIRTTNESLLTPIATSYEQGLRNTITLGGFAKSCGKKVNPKVSTTLFSKGEEIVVGPFSFVVKTDFVSMTWAEIDFKLDEIKEKFKGKDFKTMLSEGIDLKKFLVPSLGAIRFQANVNVQKLIELGVDIPNGLEIDRAIATVAIGVNLSLDFASLADFADAKYKRQKIDKKNKIKKTDIIDKNDAKQIEKLRKKSELFGDKADELAELLDGDNKPTKKEYKKVAGELKKYSDGLYEEFQSKVWKSDAGKEAAEKVMKETGEKIVKKIGIDTIKGAAKMLGRAVPIIGAVITIVEVASLLYDVYTFFNEGDLPWEADVRNYLQSIKDSFK